MPLSAACSSASSGVIAIGSVPISGANQAEELGAAAVHVLARDQRLEVESQQRLGVGGADVEMPLGVVDRDAVEVVDLGVGEAALDLGHLARLVGDLGVDLAGDEVPRA